MPPGSGQRRIVPSEADEKGICPVAVISKLAVRVLPRRCLLSRWAAAEISVGEVEITGQILPTPPGCSLAHSSRRRGKALDCSLLGQRLVDFSRQPQGASSRRD